MKCEEAGEFVSALCDGETIPREVAEHIGSCEVCRARLNAYSTIGVELRRLASLEQPAALKAGSWEKERRVRLRWWRRGRTTMKIPRFAFVSMLALILLLSTSLVLVRARTRTGGPVLMLTSRLLPEGWEGDCIITTDGNPKTGGCAYTGGMRDGTLGLSFRFISRDGDRTQLKVKATYKSHSNTFYIIDDFKDVPERIVWIEPDAQQQIKVSGLGEIELTGEYLDHLPSLRLMPKETLDPAQHELRLISPLLLRGREVMIDSNGSVTGTGKGGAVWMYAPGVGRLIISAEDFPGAVKGQVSESRIGFEIGGEQYQLLAGAPITRAQDVWVRLEPNFRSSESPAGNIGWAQLDYLLSQTANP